MQIDLGQLARVREEQCQARARYWAIKCGFRKAGEDPTFKDVMNATAEVMEVREIMSRRLRMEVCTFDAAQAYPGIMRLFNQMKSITQHTTLAAAVRRYMDENAQSHWRNH